MLPLLSLSTRRRRKRRRRRGSFPSCVYVFLSLFLPPFPLSFRPIPSFFLSLIKFLLFFFLLLFFFFFFFFCLFQASVLCKFVMLRRKRRRILLPLLLLLLLGGGRGGKDVLFFFFSFFSFLFRFSPFLLFSLAAPSVHYTTSCKHSLVLLRIGEIIARNMLS